MKKDSGQQKPAAGGGKATAADHRVAQRHHKQSQAAQLSAANVEESPHMDRADSAAGSGESLGEGSESTAAQPHRRGALDAQYGTDSAMKTAQKPGQAGRVSSAGSGSSGSGKDTQAAPNPGSSEASSGAERDTMSGSRPGSKS